MRFKCLIKFFFIFLFLFTQAKANSHTISLDLQNVSMQDAIRILAKYNALNIVISPEVRGTVSLHLHDSNMLEALDLLLASHHLTKWKVGNTWFVASHEELVQRKQEDLKLLQTSEQTAALVTRVWQIHYAKAEDIAHLLQDNTSSLLSVRGHVRVDARTNILCVQDIGNHLTEIDRLIRRLDVPIQQVLIEARLVSMDNDFERELGINFNVQSSSGSVSDTLPPHSSPAPRYSLAVATLADGSLLDVQLSAMEKQGRGELISSPSLFTSNQQAASIESGEEIPYQEVSLSGGTSIAFKKAVLSLKVTPQVLPGNKVLLQLQVNQDKPSKRTVLGVPAISTRQMITNVLVKNGQTIVLGGIYESVREEGQDRIPFLSKIPLVGILFRQQNIAENKRELLIFVTPCIVS